MAQHPEITLRDGVPEDFQSLMAILKESPGAASWVDTCLAMVAEIEGEMAGFAVYRVVMGEGELMNLAVVPKERRRGVASNLVTALFGMAPIWHLEVRETNRDAIAFYESHGFERLGRRERYYSDGEAAVLMSKLYLESSS